MIPKDTKICISTQHPGMGGGVGRQVDLITDYLFRKGFSPKIMFSSNIKKDLLFKEEFKQYNKNFKKNIITTRSYLPLFYPNYHLYGSIMKKNASDFDVCHQMGGSCLEAAPFFKAKKKYLCWVATTFSEEWRTVSKLSDFRRPASWMLRLANHLSLPAIRHLEKKIYQESTIINPVSERSAEIIRKEFKIPSEKIRVIPNPVDLLQFQGKIKHHLDFDYVLFVGRLDKRKNLEILLKAFKELSQKNLKLVIFGDGPERKHLEEEASRLGIAKYVIFTGFQPDAVKIDYLKQAKVFALTSTQEGFGISIIEAMACGIPVVSTDCGGPRDIINNEKNGFLVRVGDYKTVAQRISMIITEQSLSKNVGKAGKKSVERFDIEKIGNLFLEEYESLI
jgi:glycosyltransferase involved in cell wall biosynthesis